MAGGVGGWGPAVRMGPRGVQVWVGGFHNLKVEIVAVPPACLRVSEKLFILAYAGPLISILVGPLLSHKQPYVALKYNKEGLD